MQIKNDKTVTRKVVGMGEGKGKLYMFVGFGLNVKLKCSVHLAVSAQKPPSSLC